MSILDGIGPLIDYRARRLQNGMYSVTATWEGRTGVRIMSRQYAIEAKDAQERARQEVEPLARLAMEQEAESMRKAVELIERVLARKPE